MFLLYLLHCLLRSTLKFELHNINIVRSFYHKINTSLRRMIFSLSIEAYQLKDNEQYILIMQLQIAHQFIRSVSKETLKSFKESFRLSPTYFLNKLLYLKRSFNFRKAGLEWNQKLSKTFLYFTIRNAQSIESKLFVIAFYSKVSALEDDRYGIFVTINTVQHIGICLHLCHPF